MAKCLLMVRITFLLMIAIALSACASLPTPETSDAPCSEEWYRIVEEVVSTGDGHGHGPDLGSSEWRSVVEFKLGIRDDSRNPPRESEDWCRFIQESYIENST
jgi:hypothetical protein